MGERTPPSTRDNYAHFCTIQTRWMDVDVYGHMNNVVHYSLFDTAVNAWLVEKGLLEPKSSPSIGLVVETGCRYFSEINFPDVVTAGIRVAKIGSSSVRFEIGLFSNDVDQASAEGFFVHVYVDAETRRPVEIDQERRDAFETLRR